LIDVNAKASASRYSYVYVRCGKATRIYCLINLGIEW